LISPIQDNAARDLIEANKRQIPNQGAAKRSIEDIKVDCKVGQKRSGDGAIEQE
jgi:hypothetical protein